MSRVRKIREVAELDGTMAHDPQNYPGTVVKNSDPIGEPAKWMPLKAKKIWKELVDNGLPGVMTAADRLTMEMLCCLVVQFRDDPLKFPPAKYTTVINLSARFGFSPADRQKFIIPDGAKQNKNPYANLED